MRCPSFSEHPAAIGETYLKHMSAASSFGCSIMRSSLACIMHAMLPFLFETTGPGTVTAVHGRMVRNATRAKAEAGMFQFT